MSSGRESAKRNDAPRAVSASAKPVVRAAYRTDGANCPWLASKRSGDLASAAAAGARAGSWRTGRPAATSTEAAHTVNPRRHKGIIMKRNRETLLEHARRPGRNGRNPHGCDSPARDPQAKVGGGGRDGRVGREKPGWAKALGA